MIYREFLVMRKALAWFAGIAVGIALIGEVSGMIRITSIGGTDVVAAYLSAIFAMIYGIALGNGSREPARVLWALPTERWKAALHIIAADLGGVTIAFACVFAVTLVSLAVTGHFHLADMSSISFARIGLGLALPYAAYGWSALLGMLGRRVPTIGVVALPVLIFWVSLAQTKGQLGAVLRAPIAANPFAVYNAGTVLREIQHHPLTLDPTSSSLLWLGTTWATPVLLAIALATCSLAIALWQRAEVIV